MSSLQEFRRAAAMVQVQAGQPEIMMHSHHPAKIMGSDRSQIKFSRMRYQSRKDFVRAMKTEIEPLSGELTVQCAPLRVT